MATASSTRSPPPSCPAGGRRPWRVTPAARRRRNRGTNCASSPSTSTSPRSPTASRSTSPEKESLSYTDFALVLLGGERQARVTRRRERSLKRSHLGPIEGLDGFDFAARPQLEPRVIKELCNCRFVEEKRNILCVGKPGLGKTRIAKAVAHAACVAGYSTLCITAADMLEDLQASHADGTFKRALRRFAKPQVLLLDEFGHTGSFDHKATNHLYRVVAARYRQASIILYANTGFASWKHLFPSESSAIATVDRLVDQATILRFTGKSFRDPKEVVGAPLED